MVSSKDVNEVRNEGAREAHEGRASLAAGAESLKQVMLGIVVNDKQAGSERWRAGDVSMSHVMLGLVGPR